MKREWTDLELAEHWTLLPAEAALLANKTGPTRLGFAVLLKFFQYAGRFPLSIQELPTAAVASIAVQVGVPTEEFSRYDWQGRAVKYHRAQIRAFLGFREPTVQDAEGLAVWLSEHVLPQGHPFEHVKAAAYQRLRELAIEQPTPEPYPRIGIHCVRGTFLHRDGRPVTTGGIGTAGGLAQLGGRRGRDSGTGALAPSATENGSGAGGPR